MTNWALNLRVELARRAKEFASSGSIPYYESLGTSPTILFPTDAKASGHGNFVDLSYRAILTNPSWSARLDKPHTQRRALPENRQATARELDSCNSSDALLMNCFCYPTAAQKILGEALPGLSIAEPEFGVAGMVPLRDGSADATELDMRAGSVTFESKLTEADFTEGSVPSSGVIRVRLP